MNLIDFTKNGGFRFKQYTLKKMQEAYFHILKVFVSFLGIPDVGNFIITGCTVVGPNITAGYLYIDGELCRFEQTVGTSATLIRKDVVTETLSFKNGNNEPVFRYTTAVTDVAIGTALSAFNGVYPVFDQNYVHTDENYTNAEKTKLAGIEPGAEVNVQSDWNETNPASDAYFKNRPAVPNVLRHLSSNLHDFPNGADEIRTISFPDVGTANYMVVFTPVSNGDWNQDNDNTYVIKNKTSSSFDIAAREVTVGAIQSIIIDYILIAF